VDKGRIVEKIAREFTGVAPTKKILIKIHLRTDWDKVPDGIDPDYYSQQELLDVFPEKIARGVGVSHVEIVKGLVDKDGVEKN